MPVQLLCIAILMQAAPPANTEMQTLIQEVRSLRDTLSRTNALGLRIQLVLHRLGQQQQIVAKARDSVRDAEGRLSHIKTEGEHFARIAKDLEKNKPREPLAERELQMVKAQIEVYPRQQLEAEAAVVEAQQTLRTEIVKQEDLNHQLDELERRLTELSK